MLPKQEDAEHFNAEEEYNQSLKNYIHHCSNEFLQKNFPHEFKTKKETM